MEGIQPTTLIRFICLSSDTYLKKKESVELKQETKEEDEGIYATVDIPSFEAGQRWPSTANEAGCNR